MSKVILHIDDRGKLTGIDEKNERAYGRFRAKLEKLRPGDTLSFDFRIPRSPKFHRLHFAMMGAFFATQEVFDDRERMRKWIEVGAGHVEFMPGPDGSLVALPKSIAYEALDDVEFHDIHEGVKAFIRSPQAYRYLWPHLNDEGREQMVEAVLVEFEQ
ncbi:DUF1367 family protein [Paraburkholderia gardini]|uniref:DUF1367 family protein n=1 Tax=Paraburkholderia gardini TaxID=2823469 RepID=UPI001D7570F7|nr:DUF1367 family protein [Paraburkholderia gardini]CAG4889418.1 hypothetical protein R69919_00738 [Paraburkholderia gardini]